jgi:hypothetical protein
MLAVFCLRLSIGLLASLLLLRPDTGRATANQPDRVGFRFYRTHFLTALGLTCLAFLFVPDTAGIGPGALLVAAMVLAVTGSVVWALEGAPGGRALVVLTPALLAAALVWLEAHQEGPLPERLVGDAASAAVLGTSLTAMLLGHSYLISPTLSIRPLNTMLLAVAVAIVVRGAGDGIAFVAWAREQSLANMTGDVVLWLPVRALVGLLVPLGLDWMAWQTARIRSTQSATGILYVIVICCFLGELLALLLRHSGVTL